MKKSLIGLIVSTLLILVGCSSQKVVSTDIINGNFETGDLTGWTTKGEAFKDVVNDTTKYGDIIKANYFKEGKYHVNGAVNSGKTGELKSSHFKLSGSGFISFLVSGGVDPTKTYIVLVDAKTKKELAVTYNTRFSDPHFTNQYLREIWDVSEFLGRTVYLKIVDQDSSHFYDYLNIDDIKVNLSEIEINELEKEKYTRLIVPKDIALEKAQQYINDHASKLDQKQRMSYHVMGEVGWINDPNGFTFHNGDYHLFYQFNPYDVNWGPMHWGHVKSDDLIKWEYLPVALAPSKGYDRPGGAFSGSAISHEGNLYLMYTSAGIKQTQSMAVSFDDGLTFTKFDENPVILGYSLPTGTNIDDFRDPKIWKHEDTFYAIIGSRQKNSYGQVVIYQSKDLKHWEFFSIAAKGSSSQFTKLGRMWECPDLFHLDGTDVLIMSPQEVPNHRSGHATVYIPGTFNYTTGDFDYNYELVKEIDYGFDFYAPQTMIDDKGRRIMVAWMQSWNRAPVMQKYGWAGAMTLPRELKMVNDKLYQIPIEEIKNYRVNFIEKQFTIDNTIKQFENVNGQSTELEIILKPDLTPGKKTGIKVLSDGMNEYTDIYYKDGRIYFDRTHSGSGFIGDFHNLTSAPASINENGEVYLRIFIDRFSVEIFINHGEYTMTSTVGAKLESNQIEFYSQGNAHFNLNKYEILVS